MLTEYLNNFGKNVDEVTLKNSSEKVDLESYSANENPEFLKSFLYTALCISNDKMMQNSAETEDSITTQTFSLKDLKSYLSFCDFCCENLTIYVDSSDDLYVFFSGK